MADIADMAAAFAVGTGAERMPPSWIDLLTDDPAERDRWRLKEFRKGG